MNVYMPDHVSKRRELREQGAPFLEARLPREDH